MGKERGIGEMGGRKGTNIKIDFLFYLFCVPKEHFVV